MLLITEEIERIIVEHGHSQDIKKFAIAQGMLTLRQAGLTRSATASRPSKRSSGSSS